MKSMKLGRIAIFVLLAAIIAACAPAPAPVSPTQAPKATDAPKATAAPAQPTAAPAQPTAAPKATDAPKATEAPKAAAPKRGGTLTILNIEEVKGLFNHTDSGTEGEYTLNQITEGLVVADIDMNIVPALATSWEMSKDGLEYTFKLRQGVKFHDGTDFDADDVKWTFDQAIIPNSYMGAKWIPYIKSTQVIDKYTVKITLVEPWYDFLTMLAYEEDLDILSREAVEKWGKDYGYKAAVGTGPFKFDHWNRGEELVIVRNENYWDKDKGYPYLDKIVYRAVLEDTVKVMQLNTKAADLVFNFPFNEVDNIKKSPNIVVESTPGGTQHYWGFVADKAPFNDAKTRQAMCYAVDRKAIVDTVFRGHAAVANGIFPPQLFVAENDKVYYPYDPDKAKKLLTEAGYSDAKPLKFYMLTSNASLYMDMAVLIQAQLKKIGVQAEVVPLEKAALSTYMSGQAADSATKRQSILYRRGLSGLLMNDYTLRGYYSKGGANDLGYNKPGGGISNPEVEQLILDTYKLTDKATLITNNRKLNALILGDCPRVYIAYQNNVIAFQNYVKGLKNWPLNTMPMKQVWLDK